MNLALAIISSTAASVLGIVLLARCLRTGVHYESEPDPVHKETPWEDYLGPEPGEDVEDYVARLLELARQDHKMSFMKLRQFTTPTSGKSGYSKLAGKPYVAPSDWDDMVVVFIKYPSLDDFRGSALGHSHDEVAKLANAALVQGSLGFAKIVLAYYDSRGSRGVMVRRVIDKRKRKDLVALVEKWHGVLISYW